MLELQHVSVEFASEHSVLAVDDISMQLEKGTRTAIVGETGSGKSVLLLAILRLLPILHGVMDGFRTIITAFWQRFSTRCLCRFPMWKKT